MCTHAQHGAATYGCGMPEVPETLPIRGRGGGGGSLAVPFHCKLHTTNSRAHVWLSRSGLPAASHSAPICRPLPPRNASAPARHAPCSPTITAAVAAAQLPSNVWLNFFYAAGLAQAANDSSTEGTWLVGRDAGGGGCRIGCTYDRAVQLHQPHMHHVV